MRSYAFIFFSILFLSPVLAQDKIDVSLYSDPQGRFTIMAPKSWKIMPDIPMYKKRIWLYKNLSDSSNYAMLKVLGQSFNGNTKALSLDSMVAMYKKLGFQIKEQGTEKLGPYTAYWVIGKDYQSVYQYIYSIYTGKKMYVISGGAYEVYFNIHKDEFRTMVRSFKLKKG
jgi:hypothetical protein